MKLILCLPLLLILASCVFEKKKQDVSGAVSPSGTSSPNVSLCNSSAGAAAVDCSSDIANSTGATKSKTCNSSGSDFIYSSCSLQGCLANYHVDHEACVADACKPNESLGTVSCTDDIAFSATATKSSTCDAKGADYVYGACSVSGCLAGYHLVKNACVPNACKPNEEQGTVSCTGEIPYSASATQTKSCDATGIDYVYGDCAVTGCLAGYNLQNNSCVANACSPNQSQGIVSCTGEIPYSADATKSKTCNGKGSDSVYGSCSVSGCLPDYHLSGNSCVANTCVPNKGYGLVSCTQEISYSENATKPKSCNATGADYVYGSCTISGCLPGYNLQSNSCIANTCTPNQGLGTLLV